MLGVGRNRRSRSGERTLVDTRSRAGPLPHPALALTTAFLSRVYCNPVEEALRPLLNPPWSGL